MKANSSKAIAQKAQELCYGLQMAIKKNREADDNFIPWITFHGMSKAIESFCMILEARKSNAQYANALITIKHRMLDMVCALDKDSSYFAPQQALALAELADHVFYRIYLGSAVDESYVEFMLGVAKKHDPYMAA